MPAAAMPVRASEIPSGMKTAGDKLKRAESFSSPPFAFPVADLTSRLRRHPLPLPPVLYGEKVGMRGGGIH
ncbi:MAG: hypothetical protein ABS54_02535 [Hyphomicrobium sp. SCN 65-11]|nr:MAG: hypothetical protein ABS54_02535 [Hyphomicrobium sp. SCN 65-11]